MSTSDQYHQLPAKDLGVEGHPANDPFGAQLQRLPSRHLQPRERLQAFHRTIKNADRLAKAVAELLEQLDWQQQSLQGLNGLPCADRIY
eukprot:1162067-Pelagomonas_calceolata.AAC.4